MCLPGQCVANECPGCGAQLGKVHDEECRSAGEQRRRYFGQFISAEVA